MSITEHLKALETYFTLMSMKGAVEVFHAAQENGIIATLSNGSCTVESIAESCNLNPKAVSLVLNALSTLELATASDGLFKPAPALTLFQGTYKNLSSEYWEHLSTYLKTGIPMQQMDDPEEGKFLYETQAKVLYWMMLPSAMVVAEMLQKEYESEELCILDIGSGSSVWSITLATHCRDATITAVDWPNILEIAREFARSSGIAERFIPLSGDYRKISLNDNAYNLIIVANVVHLETEDGIRTLLRNLKNTLAPKGKILLIDVFHNQPGGELNSIIYELGLALRTESGQVYDQQILTACLRETGFLNAMYQPIPAPPYIMGMIMAEKDRN